MRVLHTSDWHLGRLFHGAPLLSEQECALARVVAIAGDADVDAVVVAGDLYDRAIPPADAVDLLAEALRELRGLGVPVVAITGNHDSPNRVGALDPLLRAGGVTLRGRLDVDAPVVVPATDGGSDLVIHPVPYQEPLAAPLVERTGERARRPTQHEVLARALDATRAEVAGRGDVRSVVVAHAFVAGAAPSDSERELSVGGVDRVPTSAFDGFTYAALGHLHRPQEVGPRAAYSGSLLPYSFSETARASVRVVELAPDGSVEAEVVELGCERTVATLEGRLDSLLADPAHRAAEQAWVRVRLHDEVLPRHAMERLRDRFPHTLVLEHVRPATASTAADPRRRSTPVTDLDLAHAFVAERFGRPVDATEDTLLRAAFDAVTAAGREDELRVAATVATADRGHDEHGQHDDGSSARDGAVA
ncbi:exonuclease SbcCD subunit D [Iamia sp. SCSIO 61187]|uniref:exonuclease SbcCD subunit D n=1 Tax=Iamia sp. SCSIO 61187 TaxID=2722752 RepID=UPI001C626136|nr:exonuclease SbcCD subunit D [Iamia sp. SCSIO 61187]QYG91691.1 exonuclease SbcCD subunit D [Iamia sp. SCSIO 61187]